MSLPSQCYTTFAGNHVTIYVKGIRGGNKGKVMPLAFVGYLMDECSEYFYLGESPEEVSACIKKQDVGAIMITEDATLAATEDDIPEGDYQ